MFCGNCGASNSSDSKFCQKCGMPLKTPYSPAQQEYAGENQTENAFISFIKKRWMILAPTLAVLIILFLSLNSIIAAISPNYSIMMASKNTMDQLDKRLDNSSLNFLQILSECFQSGSVKAEFSYDDGYYTEADGSIILMSNYAAEEYGFVTNMSVNDTDIDLTAVFDGKRLAFQTSLIDDQFYGITYDTFIGDLDKFALEADLNEDIVDSVKELYDNLSASRNNDLTKIAEKYNELLESFVITLKPVVTTEKISSGGETVSCKVVTYPITEDDLLRLLQDFRDMMDSDDALREYYYTINEAQSMNQDYIYGYDTMDPEEMYDDMLDDLDDIIDVIEDDYSGTINLSFYLSGNKLVRFGLSGDPEMDGDELEFEAYVDFGKNADKNDIEIVLQGETDYSEFELTISFRTVTQGNTITDSIELRMDEDGYDSTMSITTEWNRETGNFEAIIETYYDEFEISGNLTVDKDSFTFVLDDLLENAYYDPDLDLTISAQRNAEIPSPDYINLDQWGEAFVSDLEQGVANLLYQNYGYYNEWDLEI